MFITVLRIRDVYPGSEFFPSRIRIFFVFKYNPKNWFLSSRKYDPGWSSWIRIPDHGSRGQKGAGSRIRNTGLWRIVTYGTICTRMFKIYIYTKYSNFDGIIFFYWYQCSYHAWVVSYYYLEVFFMLCCGFGSGLSRVSGSGCRKVKS